ncbi:MAG: protein kinase [Acidobacteriota bacterium]
MSMFGAERWRTLSPHLDRLLDLSPEERSAALESLRLEDPDLAQELAALLEEHMALESQGFLSGNAVPQTAPSSLAGLVVGSYTLRTPLGQGGMGTVWLADRSDGRFEGVAAVKLLNASLIGREGEARFQREGSLLARVRHPNIAHLIDAGVSSLGQPYLVIEHVDGARIDHYCDAARLGIEQRTRLFLDVCAAVAFAHTNLVIHRDLKPPNVLVDKDGRVKLLDFGIAKLLEQEGSTRPETALTREGESALTPQYAAPEQLTGGPITTATDVYALGVVLYMLLTGCHPSGPTNTSPSEWVKAVVEKPPPRPSAAVMSQPEHAARCDSAPGKLARSLKGDLDNILAKALEKNPEERYASVESLADDLRRFLNNEPVIARRDSLPYRTLKFARRHRVGVAAAGLVASAVLAGTIGVAWQAGEAASQRDAARTQLARATAANEFTTYLLSVAAPGGGKFTVGELLKQGEALIDKQFADDDAMRSEMLATIGQQYFLADRFEEATAVLTRAAEIAARTGDPALRARAGCPLALMTIFNDNRPAAESMMQRALSDLPDEPQYALQRAECLTLYSGFGVVTAEAEPMIARANAALAILDRTPTAAKMKRIEAKLGLAYGLVLAKRVRDADRVYAEIVKEIAAVGRERTIVAADAYNEWGIAHYHDNLLQEEPLVRRAVELRRSIDAEGTVGPSYTGNYAAVLRRLARYDQAEPLYQETIRTALAQDLPRARHTAMMDLSALYLDQGKIERAAIQLATVEPLLNDPRFSAMSKAKYAYHSGRLLAAKGNMLAARDSFARSVELFEAETEKVSNGVDALIGLARAELALGDSKAAMGAAERALVAAEAFIEKQTPSYLIGEALVVRGEVQRSLGLGEAARGTFKNAAEHLRQTLGADHPETLEALKNAAL